MIYALQLEDGSHVRQVPLADGTAVALERSLVAIDWGPRIAELTAAIVCDPALAVWVALQTRRRDSANVLTAACAATWLGSGLAEKLTAGAILPEDAQLQRVPATEARSVAALHATTISTARARHAAAGSHVTAAESAAYWSAVMEDSSRLLAAWPSAMQAQQHPRPTVPPAPRQWLCDRVEPTGDELVDFFLATERGIERRLPALLAKVCYCERQLADFDRRLEDEKLAALKELAYGAGHEINNPLANIAARAQTLAQDEDDPERRRKLVAIHRQAMRAHEMIADLMLFARPPELNFASCDLGSLVRQVVAELAEVAEEREIELVSEITQPAIVLEADQTQLTAALQAVVTNALEAVGTGGHVAVLARETLSGGERRAELVVRDDGPGISDEVRRHIFDPFFSGREAGRGLGFGLSKCWRIITDHGGQVVVGRSPRGGCELAISLPVSRRTASLQHGR